MSRRQQIITSIDCDLCDEAHEGVDTFRMLITRARKGIRPAPRDVDVCEHWATILNGMAERIRKLPAVEADMGDPQPALPLTDEPVRACPMCTWSGKPAGLMTHLTRLHKVQAPRQPRKCPDCPYTSDSAPLMSQHRARHHAYVHLDALVAVAEKRRPK